MAPAARRWSLDALTRWRTAVPESSWAATSARAQVEAFERRIIVQAMTRTSGNQAELGIERATVR